MKKNTVTLILLCMMVFSILLPITVNGQETTLSTVVPSNHMISLSIEGKGTVVIDGKQYSKPVNISIHRHREPFVQIQAEKDYYARSVTYNQENITYLFNNGEWTMPKIETDVSLSVVFVKDSGNPPTGDTFNPWIMVLLMASILGLIVCILNIHKRKLI